eukprot:2051172-Rhodomonas_salina.3
MEGARMLAGREGRTGCGVSCCGEGDRWMEREGRGRGECRASVGGRRGPGLHGDGSCRRKQSLGFKV